MNDITHLFHSQHFKLYAMDTQFCQIFTFELHFTVHQIYSRWISLDIWLHYGMLQICKTFPWKMPGFAVHIVCYASVLSACAAVYYMFMLSFVCLFV